MTEETVSGDFPIFVHAPWRSGSTFLFELFRRHDDRFFCFQEPLNDWTVRYRDEPDMLLSIGGSLSDALRHPTLAQPYFKELYDVREAWAGKLDKAMLYDDYFDGDDRVDAGDFFGALIGASPRRPVIQECRTLGRIGSLKRRFGGFHIAAFRNPIDLWWSQKATPFFEAGRALIINAANPPPVIARFRDEVSFGAFHDSDLMVELDNYRGGHLAAGESYLELHLIWSLAVIEAVRHADLVINMDQLSAHADVATRHKQTLETAGIESIALEECRMPLRRLTQREIDRFKAIEEKSFGMLAEAGEPVDLVHQFIAETEISRPLSGSSDSDRESTQYRDLIWQSQELQISRQRHYLAVMAEMSGHFASLQAAFETLHANRDYLAAQIEKLEGNIGSATSTDQPGGGEAP